MSETLNRGAGAAVDRPELAELERAVQALRTEWRDGLQGRRIGLAQQLMTSLNRYAGTHSASEQISGIIRSLAAYRELSPEERKVTLPGIAERIKALEPHLVSVQAPSQKMGRLPDPPRKSAKQKTRSSDSPQRPLSPDDSILALSGVGQAQAEKLAKLGIKKVMDLLRHRPRRYIDYTRTTPIGGLIQLQRGSELDVTIQGQIIEIKEVPWKRSGRTEAKISDGTGWARITWFTQFVARQLAVGDTIALNGQLAPKMSTPSFTSPDWERIDRRGGAQPKLKPVYSSTEKLPQNSLRGWTAKALAATRETLPDPLPAALKQAQSLMQLHAAYEASHYPPDHDALRRATRRLLFDDLFFLQLGLVKRKKEVTSGSAPSLAAGLAQAEYFLARLPFELTGAQRRVTGEVLTDIGRTRPMNRLLQGDVGSGKTVVAAAAALATVGSGYQAAVMAPTEILAEQHARSLPGLFAALQETQRPVVRLLTGSTKAAERRALLPAVAAGEIDILVGTHAVIQGSVEFARLGLSVVDEQHRFGVRQRAELPRKAGEEQPHVLSMTATPIPRTLNMVLFGDMDVSIVDEKPPGREPVDTRRYVGDEREAAYDIVRTEVAAGRQIFVICPLVEDSNLSEEKSAVTEAARLQSEVFPNLRIALLHGRMSGRDKDRIMSEFRGRQYDILVATSVIEVGIDVPNATVMLVEGADRFGLSQLHQFRGRVGRGGGRSYCLLLADDASFEGEARLNLMVATTDGFVLAEEDLKLRGPGDFLGTRQSGLPDMPWLKGGYDARLLDEARRAAEQLLVEDPDLSHPANIALAKAAHRFWSTVALDIAFN